MCFVIPTYNEAENITLLLGRLTDLYPDPNTLFLVVDDESPDGTGALVRQCAGGDARVHLLEGRKRGLGAAYVRGIVHAMDSLGADVVVQMDADFSHDPKDAGRLLARVATGRGRGDRQPLRRRRRRGRDLGLSAPAAFAVGQPDGALDCRAERGAATAPPASRQSAPPRCGPPG